MAITPEMNLDLPTVSSTLGPQWASDLNAALELVDAHDHSSGKGPKVTPAGILINATLDMAGEALQSANSLGMSSLASADTSAYALGSLQIINNNLYFVNSAGTSIQITNSGSLINIGGRIFTNTVTTPYTVLSSDLAKVLLVNTTSSAFTLNLPLASTNIYFWVKDLAGNAQTNNITVNRAGADTIDGSASAYVIDYNYANVGFISDGSSSWYVM